MTAPKILSLIAFGLTLFGVGALTLIDTQHTVFDYISRLNEVNASVAQAANGLFFLMAIFWMGSVNTIRRTLEPKKVDAWLMYSAIAFAASYILSVVFPCDEGCPPFGSTNQILHSTLVWCLYGGPVVFAGRLIKLKLVTGWPVILCWSMVSIFLIMQIDTLFIHSMPGVWQRVYDLGFCILWWLTLTHYLKTT
jgi:hypothetical protein